jgi:hypothetical protein
MPDRPGHPRAKRGAETHVGQPAPAARVAKQSVRAGHDMRVDVVAALAWAEQVLRRVEEVRPLWMIAITGAAGCVPSQPRSPTGSRPPA